MIAVNVYDQPFSCYTSIRSEQTTLAYNNYYGNQPVTRSNSNLLHLGTLTTGVLIHLLEVPSTKSNCSIKEHVALMQHNSANDSSKGIISMTIKFTI